jgi:putative endonuclease
MRRVSGDFKGRRAELRAELLLRLKGYRILMRRYRTGLGEVDLIASRGRVVAFIEVKFRETRTAALESVSERQRRRIRAAANAYLAHHPQVAEMDCRFDVIVVTRALLPHHLLNAWSASDHNTG